MSRFRLLIEYDGSGFQGWQRQAAGLITVQGALEEALTRLCDHPVTVVGAGRTDSGVHALGQVAHFDTHRPRSAEVYMRALNALTPETVTVLAAEKVPENFHARFSARYREYLYRLSIRSQPPALERGRVWHLRHRPDLAAMQAAAAILQGCHDFSAFRAASCQAAHPIRTLSRVSIYRHDPDEIRILLGADAFLQHMVRNIVGSLIPVGQGNWSVEKFHHIFFNKERSQAGPTAPPDGLYLVRVEY